MEKNEEKNSSAHQNYTWADVAPSDIVRIQCPTGHTAEFIQAGDMYFPLQMKEIALGPDQRLNVERVKRMKIRENDIFVCAYPKSGTHWIWEITHMLVKGVTEYSQMGKVSTMIEFRLPDEFDNLPSPRILNSHYEFHNLPKKIAQKKCKIIYIQRNPKDVAVSNYHFDKAFFGDQFTGSWKDYFHLFLNDVNTYMNWFKSTISWEHTMENKDLNILSLYYEDFKEDPVREITRMAKFLNVTFNKETMAEIAEKCSFKKMKESKKGVRKELTMEVAKSTQQDVNSEDTAEKAASIVYRKGDVGDWKNWFTVAQAEHFDAVYAEKMKDSKLQFRYVL